MDVRSHDEGKLVHDSAKEIKLLRDEPKLSKEDSQETRHLKELLLLHLDLIQQQQETILMKDRQLQAHAQEKSAVWQSEIVWSSSFEYYNHTLEHFEQLVMY